MASGSGSGSGRPGKRPMFESQNPPVYSNDETFDFNSPIMNPPGWIHGVHTQMYADTEIPNTGFFLNESPDDIIVTGGSATTLPTQEAIIGDEPKGKSWVWEHMTKSKVDGKIRATCKFCKSTFAASSKGGTGHIARHLEKCLPKHGQKGKTQSQIHSTSSATEWGNFHYSDELHRHELARFVIKSELPLSTAENESLHEYVHRSLNPAAKFPSRNTLKKYCFEEYLALKSELMLDFTNINSAICLTSDAWSTVYSHPSYCCITAHYVDSEWTLQKRIISFAPLEYPHSGSQIAHSIISAACEFSIDSKIFTITFDNATNNDSAIPILKNAFAPIMNGSIFHVRCVCHIINLVVQDGLKLINPEIEKIKLINQFIRCSGQRKQDFKEICHQHRLKYKTFSLDTPTRWNSTYLLLKRAYEYKDPLDEYLNTRMQTLALDEDEWNKCYIFQAFLEKFYEFTNLFSGYLYPSSHLVVSKLVEICEVFNEYRLKIEYSEIVSAMETKFNKYWEDTPPLFCLAAVMDPRIRLENLDVILTMCNDYMKKSPIKQKLNAVSLSLYEMFDLYQSKYAGTGHQASQKPPGKASTIFARLNRTVSSGSSKRGPSISELQNYLQTDFTRTMDEDQLNALDIFSWWKHQSQFYPVLSMMARDLLTVPVSTVASEQAFSAGSRVLDEKRTRLGSDVLEMLICSKDWLIAKERNTSLQDEFEGSSDD